MGETLSRYSLFILTMIDIRVFCYPSLGQIAQVQKCVPVRVEKNLQDEYELAPFLFDNSFANLMCRTALQN